MSLCSFLFCCSPKTFSLFCQQPLLIQILFLQVSLGLCFKEEIKHHSGGVGAYGRFSLLFLEMCGHKLCSSSMPGSFPELVLVPSFHLRWWLTRAADLGLSEWLHISWKPFAHPLQGGGNSNAQRYLFIYLNIDFKGSLQSFDFETSWPRIPGN